MLKIRLKLDPRQFTINNVRLSTDETNALAMDANGNIFVGISNNPDTSYNTFGNGVDGTGDTDNRFRLNKTVTRKVLGDPNESNEGLLIDTLIAEILA